MRKLLTGAAALALLGLAVILLADRNVRAQIYALPAAAACLVTPGSTTGGWVVSWGSTNGCSLATGYPVANSGANTVLETDSGGHIDASTIPTSVVKGPGSSTDGYVARWSGTGGNQLATGTQVGNSGANVILQADSGGKIDRSAIPMPLDTGATGHLSYTGTTPGLQSNCGTGATIGGNDVAGRITLGSAPGGYCAINFAASWVNNPVCSVWNETTGARGVFPQPSTGSLALVATSGSLTASDVLAYQCIGYQ